MMNVKLTIGDKYFAHLAGKFGVRKMAVFKIVMDNCVSYTAADPRLWTHELVLHGNSYAQIAHDLKNIAIDTQKIDEEMVYHTLITKSISFEKVKA